MTIFVISNNLSSSNIGLSSESNTHSIVLNPNDFAILNSSFHVFFGNDCMLPFIGGDNLPCMIPNFLLIINPKSLNVYR